MIRIFTILSFSILLAHQSFGQWTNDINLNTEVSDIAGSEQSVPHSVTTSDGLTYISWFDNSNGTYRFRMQLLDAKGIKLWEPDGKIVSDKAQNTAIYRYDLKLDHQDNAIVAFQDERTGQLQVVAYKLDKSGNQLWGNDGISLIDTSSSEGLGPTIGVIDNDDVIIAWNADDNTNKWIAFNKLSSNGVIQWDSLHRVKDATASKKYSRPSIIAAKSVGFYMLYAEEGGGFGLPPSTMFTQLYKPDGTTYWQIPMAVSTKKIPFFFFPEPVSDNNAGYYIAYNTSNPDVTSLGDVYVQRITTTGVLFGADGVQACNSSSNFKSLSGSVYIENKDQLWVLVRMQDVNQSLSGVYVQAIKGNSAAVFPGNGKELLPVDANFYIPVEIGNSNDGLVIIYTESTVTNDLIKSVKIDYTGINQWNPKVVPLSIPNGTKFNISLGGFVNNQAVIVWQDSRIDYGIYAQNITSEGTTNIPNLNIPGMYVSLFPNPSIEPKLYFDLKEKENLHITVNSISGNVLSNQDIHLDAGLNSTAIINKNLASGTYLINIISTKGTKTLKWIKNN